MSEYDQPMAAPGESYIVAPDSPSTHKKGSILGKLKDKTRKAGSKIKSKVGKKKNPDGTDAPAVEGEEHEEEEESTSDDSPSPSPATSAPRELGSSAFQSEPSRFGSDNGASKEESAPVSDMSGLSLEDPAAAKEEFEPSVTEKASEGAKDAALGGAGATAGALGINEASEEKPSVTEKASEATEDLGAKTEEIGDKGYDAATDATDTVAEQTKETSESTESKAYEANDATESKAMDTEEAAESKAYEAKDAVESKAADVNNATDDSETYTDKAANAAVGAKDAAESKVADVNNATDDSESYTDKATNAAVDAKDAAEAKAADVNNATDDSESYTDKATNAAAGAKDAVESKAADVNNATNDSETYTEKAANAVQPSSQESSPSVVDKVKETLGMDKDASVVDHEKDQTAPTVESAKESTQGALDATKGHAAQAKDTVVEAATPKQEDKALSEKVTEALGALPAKASDTAAGVTQSAKSPTTTTPGTLTDAPAAHASEPAPGILGKIGGLFGFGAKPHEEHPHDAAH